MQTARDEHALITRRWTDELTRAGSSDQLARQGSLRNDAQYLEEQKQLKQLYESPYQDAIRAQDFEVANIAREQLVKIIDRFNEKAKPSTWQQLGFSHKPVKTKAAEVFRKSVEGEISDLRESVDNLEAEWKQNHGQVHAAFKKICGTLDDHKSILKVFPSQNNYASPLVGSVTILMKAAKSHNEISHILSKSIAEISDKVATCSNVLAIIKTPRARKKLAEIYARMFQFYQDTLEWYLQSKFGRFMRSFNENLVKEFEDAKKDIEDSINELYREAAVANTAMVAMVNGKVMNLEAELYRQRHSYEARDILAGKRMEKMMQATWTEVKQLESMIELATTSHSIEPSGRVEDVSPSHSTSHFPHASELHLDSFIIGNEGPELFDKGRFWVAEKDVLIKLRAWMADNTRSRTIWVSSQYKPGVTVPACRAAAMAMLAAAWQAETPIISFFCERPRHDQLQRGLSIEQVGLISLVYSFIRQLLQFNRDGSEIEIEDKDLDALNGEESSWEISLKVLKELLNHTPVVTFCVIDGLEELEWGNGAAWCKQLLNILKKRQEKAGLSFNIFFSTAGQSRVLPTYVDFKNRHLTTRRANEVVTLGKAVAVQLAPS